MHLCVFVYYTEEFFFFCLVFLPAGTERSCVKLSLFLLQ